jgi:hypothetical protein
MSRVQIDCRHPERCVIGQPFNPSHLVPLVEVVGGERTGPRGCRAGARRHHASQDCCRTAKHLRKGAPQQRFDRQRDRGFESPFLQGRVCEPSVPEGTLVAVYVGSALLLVRSSYRVGWHLPGGRCPARRDAGSGGAAGASRRDRYHLIAAPCGDHLRPLGLLTLVLSSLVAGAVYWVHGDIEFSEQRRSVSP